MDGYFSAKSIGNRWVNNFLRVVILFQKTYIHHASIPIGGRQGTWNEIEVELY